MYHKMEKYFCLTVPKGSTVHSATTSKVITGVPENALDLVSEGCTWLMLNADAVEYLKDQPEAKLKALLKVRKTQGYKSDVAIIEKALKAQNSKPADKVKKTDQPVEKAK